MANDDQKRNDVSIDVESLVRRAESREDPVNQRRPSIFMVPSIDSLLHWAESGEDPVDQRPSVFMVPSILRDVSPDSFKPRLVSIGPLHKEDPNVQDIERLKSSYLHDLLRRSSEQPKTKLEACWQKVKASISEIKSFYSATIYRDDDLATMMVMDACFILEFCIKECRTRSEPIMLTDMQRFRISVDLMLLENQIPFFVLQYIFDLIKPDSTSPSLTSLLQKVLLYYIHPFYTPPTRKQPPDDFSLPDVLNISNHKHVLDCLHKIYQFEPSEAVDDQTALDYNQSVGTHSVVELERSGVNFKPHEEKNKSMAMKFVIASSCFLGPWRKPPTLEMPTFIIQDFTEDVLRNYIAYEQFVLKKNYFFTSYSFLMDKLINDQADVRYLLESQVLQNLLGSREDAATVINSICKNVRITEFYYNKEIKALDEYYNSFWPNTFAHLRRTYFNNPWSCIALLAGIILFGLTVVQTIFTILSYYR